MTKPLAYRWTGDSFAPLPGFAAACDEAFAIGKVYRLEEAQDRSQASHNHFFAIISEAWSNLPDHLAERFATAEHLRKWSLVKAGYHDSRTLVASSKAEAQRLAAFVRPLDEFAIVTVTEATVTVYTAQSQSVRAMGREAFQKSKDGVLHVLAEMLGTTPDALAAAGKAAA